MKREKSSHTEPRKMKEEATEIYMEYQNIPEYQEKRLPISHLGSKSKSPTRTRKQRRYISGNQIWKLEINRENSSGIHKKRLPPQIQSSKQMFRQKQTFSDVSPKPSSRKCAPSGQE